MWCTLGMHHLIHPVRHGQHRIVSARSDNLRTSDNTRLHVQFYGNTNENTKRLFRDRLKARATPTLALFDSSGHMGHQHSGANKSRLEFYLREFINETDSETLYPQHQLTGASVVSVIHTAIPIRGFSFHFDFRSPPTQACRLLTPHGAVDVGLYMMSCAHCSCSRTDAVGACACAEKELEERNAPAAAAGSAA